MQISKKAALAASSLMFISGIACGAAIMSTWRITDTAVSISAEDCVYNGLIYTTDTDNTVIITGHTEEADLVNLVIPDEIEGKPVVSIEDRAFYGCVTLKTLDLGKNVTCIGKYAFAGISDNDSFHYINLSEITVYNSFGYIGNGAFDHTIIQRVNISASCSSVPRELISNESVTEINVEQGNKNYSSDKGILYSADFSTLLKCPANSYLSNYTTHENTTLIQSNAFYNCINLRTIVMGDKIKEIEFSAFFNCNRLSNIVLGKNLTSIDRYAFMSENFNNSFEEKSYAEITLPDNLQVLGDNAFNGLNITKLNVPSSVTCIPDVLYKGYFLEEISVDEHNKYFSSDKGVLYSADKSILIKCPINTSLTSYTVNENTRTISDHAFELSRIRKIELGDGVISIGSYTFRDCYDLSIVTMGKNVRFVGDYAFYEDNFCDGDINLSELTIPDNILTLGNDEFSNFSFNKVHIEKLIIPASVTYIPDLFYNNPSLKEISVDKNNKYFYSDSGILYSADKSKLIKCPDSSPLLTYDILNFTTEINSLAFNNTNIQSVFIPSSVKSIADSAFSESNLNEIKGITGSYAEKYAGQYKIKFVPTEPAAVTTAPNVTTMPPVVTTTPVKTTTVPVTTVPQKTTSAPVTSAVKPEFTYDVNCDGKINIMDIMYLKKYILNSK